MTLNSVTWIPASAHALGGLNCTAVEITITGTSASPFKYDESYLTGAYGGFAGDDGDPEGGDPSADYIAAAKLPPLRSGQVTKGQTVHGYVILPLQDHDRLGIELSDPDDSTHTEAQWIATD